jgi:hypothetical protein
MERISLPIPVMGETYLQWGYFFGGGQGSAQNPMALLLAKNNQEAASQTSISRKSWIFGGVLDMVFRRDPGHTASKPCIQ